MTARNEMKATRQVVTAEKLKAIFSEDELPQRSTIQTCDGEWRIEPDGRYRFWRDPERD